MRSDPDTLFFRTLNRSSEECHLSRKIREEKDFGEHWGRREEKESVWRIEHYLENTLIEVRVKER